MAHWDVSAEVRGEHGKWTKGGAALKRMAKEAASGASSTRGGISHDEASGHIGNLKKGTGRRVGGVMVDRTQGDKYRVGFFKPGGGRDTRTYDSVDHAAKAVSEGKHHDAGAVTGRATKATAAATPSKPDITTQTTAQLKEHLTKGTYKLSEVQAEIERRQQAKTKPATEAKRLSQPMGTKAEIAARATPATSRPTPLKEGERLGRKLVIKDLPAGYSVHQVSGRKDYAGREVKSAILMHETQGHIADLNYSESTHQVRGRVGNIAVGSRIEKGYTYQLRHPEARAALKAERESRTRTGTAWSNPTGFGTTDTKESIGRSAQHAIEAHQRAMAKGEASSAKETALRQMAGKSPAAVAKEAAAQSGAKADIANFNRNNDMRRAMTQKGLPVPPHQTDVKMRSSDTIEAYNRATQIILEGRTANGIAALDKAVVAAYRNKELAAAAKISAYRDSLAKAMNAAAVRKA